MYKVRNKKIALMTALVFVMTLVLPMGAAFGAEEPDVSCTTATVTDSDDNETAEVENAHQNLGYIKIDGDDLSSAETVYLDVELPSGVEFTKAQEDTFDSSDDSTYPAAANIFVDNEGRDYGATLTYFDSDELFAEVPADADKDLYIVFKGDTTNVGASVTVDSDADDEIAVTLDAKATGIHGGTAWEIDESFVVGQKKTGDITATADDPEVVNFGEGKEIATITIEEAYAGQFSASDAVYLELPDEFSWTKNDGGNLVKDSVDITTKYGVNVSDWYLDAEDNQVLVIDMNDSTGQYAGSLEIDAKITVLPDASEGDVEVDVTLNNSDFDSTDLVVATVGESDVTVEVDDSTGMEDYMRKAGAGELWEITFETTGSIDEEEDILIELPDGFEFVEASTANIEGAVNYKGLYDDKQGIWLQTSKPIEDDFSISNLMVAALPDCEYGDIEIDISGDVVETSVVAGNVKPSITVETEVNKVEPGLTELAGNITFTETDEDALDDVEYIYFSLPSGVEFAEAPTVEVSGEELDGVTVGPEGVDGNYDDDVLKVELAELDTNEIDTIVMSDIKYVIDSRFSAGQEIAMSVGGEDKEDMVNNLDEVDETQFEDEYDDALLEVANAVVQEAGTVEASFTLGDEGVAIQNGRTLVQVNKLCDVLDLQKSWDAASKTAYFVKDGTVVAFPIDQNKLVINGNELVVDQGGTIINNYTYATLRGIQMAFGGDLEWNNETKTATFNFKK